MQQRGSRGEEEEAHDENQQGAGHQQQGSAPGTRRLARRQVEEAAGGRGGDLYRLCETRRGGGVHVSDDIFHRLGFPAAFCHPVGAGARVVSDQPHLLIRLQRQNINLCLHLLLLRLPPCLLPTPFIPAVLELESKVAAVQEGSQLRVRRKRSEQMPQDVFTRQQAPVPHPHSTLPRISLLSFRLARAAQVQEQRLVFLRPPHEHLESLDHLLARRCLTVGTLLQEADSLVVRDALRAKELQDRFAVPSFSAAVNHRRSLLVLRPRRRRVKLAGLRRDRGLLFACV
mmetsp:Transcript_35572/g.80268  ORF Transcript_35572/g.80268 Transcript_35572/m.80268 type:complete len:286 (-) Transcript_35572:136-993(-)